MWTVARAKEERPNVKLVGAGVRSLTGYLIRDMGSKVVVHWQPKRDGDPADAEVEWDAVVKSLNDCQPLEVEPGQVLRQNRD